VFAKEFYAELSQLERGARPVLDRHADRLTMLRFAPELLLDVDTPDDYERAIERLSESC
jgi:CTP:molybdopterin cytidylyltransferase MocA